MLPFSSKSWALLLYCLLLLVPPSLPQRNPKILTMGTILTRFPDNTDRHNDGWGWESVGSAMHIAIDKFMAAGGLIGGMQIRMVRVNDACQPKKAVHVLLDLHQHTELDVVFGPSCADIIQLLGLIMSYWNLPYWPYGGTEPSLEDKVTQDVMVRIHATGSMIGIAFAHLFERFGWNRVVMLTSVTYCDMGARGISNEFTKQGYQIAEWVQTLSGEIRAQAIDDILDRLRRRGRIFIVCFDHWGSQQRFFERAEAKGMTTSDYVYLFYSIRGAINQRIWEPWAYERSLTMAQKSRASRPYFNYKQVTLTTLSGEAIEDFYDEVPLRMAAPPINDNFSVVNGFKGSWQGVNLHDATLTYLTVLNETLRAGEDYRDGTVIFEKMVNRRVEGMQLQSPLLYDSNADRVPNFWMWSFSPHQSKFEVAVEMVMTDPPDKRMHEKGLIYWGTPDNTPPPDVPACGFNYELCVVEEHDTTSVVIGLSLAGVGVVLFASLGIGLLIRRKNREAALQQMGWKVHFDDIEVSRKEMGRSSTSNDSSSVGSMGSAETGSSGRTTSEGGKGQVFCKMGVYKGMTVAIKWVEKDSVFPARRDLLELKTMRELSHDNINPFGGACTEPPNICYLMQYCSNGSLQDILENDNVKLDWSFKMSFISDIIAGMSYLHKSDLVSHGRLKSGNCLVDGRWVLKISDYGLRLLREGEQKDQTEYEHYRNMLWTAPELLRLPHRPFYGTQKGDIYSFAIVLQEIVYRALPYFLGDANTPKDMVQRVARGVDPPFRPRLQELTDDTNPAILDLMIVCWYEDPNDRPDFETCRKKVLGMNNGKKIDMMANILEKLEKYTGNLEEIVNQRAAELVEEKNKTDLLLYNMMPRSVAEQLKNGKRIDAELYNEVTVYFSDIVGFTALSTESSPMQLIDFLNDLYTLFDDIIHKHDVYKVETIGDAYMVVSGLPKLNGQRHVGEIANMALDLMSSVHTTFRVRHRPGMQVKLRVGMHTGPCAAGVVGVTMPRFCLFGDTVNTASRMESNGEPSRIHMSEASHQAIVKLRLYKTFPRGEMEIKGKGMQMTYWLTGKDGYSKALPALC